MSGAHYQPLPRARRHAKTKRQPLLSSCAIAAAMTAVGYAGPVRAQAFLGAPTTVSGTVGYNRSTPGVETITVSSPTAVVDWTPSDTATGGGAINYLPAGNVATFSSITDFTILNRIMPADSSRAVTFNGSVLGQIGASAPTTGGNIWFYSPGGIIAGATAQFDVGGLMLTTNAIQLGVGDTLPTGTIQFRGATDSRSGVTIDAGATINALNSGSYVALVAPRISQGGTVTVNGSAAYVAAESADITINGGLFDIAVQTGSAVNTGGETTLTHSGTTTGAGATSGADPRAIYMVAMPKNDAVTMLVGGSIGYASSAAVENGVVVLSAGLNLTSASNGLGGVDVTRSAGPAPGINADFTIANAAFSSRLAGYAAHDARIDQGTGTTSFASSASLIGGNAASITVNGGSLLAEGDVLLDASAIGSNGANGGNATGGTASITLVNATMETNRSIGTGGLRVLANGTGGIGLTGGNGTGGSATISVDDSALTIGTVGSPQTLRIEAKGTGGNGTNGGTGGSGQGGTASLTIFDSTPLTPSADTSVSDIVITAQGNGGGIEFGYGGNVGAGGSGFGGNASLSLSAGIFTAPGITLDATANGASGTSANSGPAGGSGGSATGGTATFTVDGGTFTGGSSYIYAGAQAGSGGSAFDVGYGASGAGGNGGAALAGVARFVENGGAATGNFFLIDATGVAGRGGFSSSAAGGAGGGGTGGNASATISAGTFAATSTLDIEARGRGGSGGQSNTLATGGTGGSGQAGTARLAVPGGSATIATLGIYSTGFGGAGGFGASFIQIGPGGDAHGGTADASVSSGSLTITGGATLDASASFDGGEGGPGDAFGGTASFLVNNGGTLGYTGTSSLMLLADGDATTGSNGSGGSATGGSAFFTVDDATATISPTASFYALELDASGVGSPGTGTGANGGSGTGGTAALATHGGTVTLGGALNLMASGTGGDTDAGGNGGFGQGGTASVFSGGGLLAPASPGAISLSFASLDARGRGGDAQEFGYGATPGDGGAGTGGTATFATGNGSITSTGSANLLAIGTGGDGIDGGDGGSGTGGTASILSGADANGAGLIDIPDLFINVGGFGSSTFESGYGAPAIGGDGGFGSGGGITLGSSGGALALSSLSLSAEGNGGDGGSGSSSGGDGGAATGGAVTFTAGGGAFDASGLDTTISIAAFGGQGGSGSSSGSVGGNGGSAVGGTFTLSASGGVGALTLDPSIFDPNAPNVEAPPRFDNSVFGGSGGSGGSGTTGGRGGNGGNATGSTIELATNLGTVTIDGLTSVSITAVAGDGGSGGDGSNVGNTGGAGGNGGDGTGGIIRVNVAGGAVNLGTTEFFAHGNGGFAGSGGIGAGDSLAVPPIPATPASNGLDGHGFGGTVSILADDDAGTGAAGSAHFGDTTINVGGFFNDGFDDIGGRIEIHDNGAAPGGGISFASLDAVSTGFSQTSDQAFDLFSAERRIAIAGDATIDLGGPAYFRATGGGGVDIGGTLDLNTASFAFVQHDFQPATAADTISANDIFITTNNDFRAFPDSRIHSANGIKITSFGGIDLNGATAGTYIDLDAPGSISGGNWLAGAAIEVDAGYDPTALDDDNVIVQPNSTFTAGDIMSTGGEIDIEATGLTTGGAFSAGHELSITSLTGGVTLASATAGTLDVPASPGNNRSIGIAAANDITIGDATAAADIGLASLDGSIAVDSIDAGGSAVLLSGNEVNLGSVTANGLFYVASSSMLPTLGTGPNDYNAGNLIGVTPDPTVGNVTISDTVNAGPVVIASGGAISFADLGASSFVQLGAGTTVTGGAIVSGSNVAVDAPDGITLGSIAAADDIDLTSSNGAVLVSNDLAADGLISALGTNVRLKALGDVNIHQAVATAGDVVLNSGGSLGVEVANATRNATLTSGGDMTVSDVVSARNNVSISADELLVTGTGQVRSDGDIAIQTVGDSRIQAGGLIGGGTAPPAGLSFLGFPANSVSINAGQTLFVDGTIGGLSIDLASHDIAIGSGSLIGVTLTTLLRLSNNGTSRTFIGGGNSTNGYSLSNAEFGRLQAQQIAIFGPRVGNQTGAPADVSVGTLDITGSQTAGPPINSGPFGGPSVLVGPATNSVQATSLALRRNLVGNNAGLFIITNGSLAVEGNVALTSAGANDTLALIANRRIDVIAPQGSIAITDAQNALGGRLELFANTVQVSTAQAAQDIAGLTDTNAIDQRLGTNDGALRPEGYLQANRLDFDVENALYIQNSGGPGLGSAARAGFTAGSGGVFVDTGQSSSARIVINGRQSDGNGGFIGGADLIPLLTINGTHNPTGGFDLRSTANGCLIVGQSCRFDLEPTAPPIQDVIEKIVDVPDNQENQDGTAVVQALNLPLLQLVNYAGLTFAPLIDEPVTGTGNDDFWIGDEEKDEPKK